MDNVTVFYVDAKSFRIYEAVCCSRICLIRSSCVREIVLSSRVSEFNEVEIHDKHGLRLVYECGTPYTASLLSTRIIAHFLDLRHFVKIPVNPVRYPYVSSAPIELCRKICLISSLAKSIIERLPIMKLRDVARLIHYMFKLLGLNYDVEQASEGRLLYEHIVKH